MEESKASNELVILETLRRIEPIDSRLLEQAAERQRHLTKPEGSLGRLEEVANRCFAIFGGQMPSVPKARIVVFAGDHGVCAEGVNPYPQAVTTQMVLNCLQGGAAINCLARVGNIGLRIVDVGVIGPLPDHPELARRNVARGTANFCTGPAMTSQELYAALRVGIEMANDAVNDGCELLGFGEFGIGNTTSASAVTAALTGLPAKEVVGRGTGADDDCLRRKISAVERGLALHAEHAGDPLEVLRRLGGFEIAAMCGFCLGAAANHRPVLTDGLIATSAAALAVRMRPEAKDYLFAAHASTEPGHRALLQQIGQKPLLQLDLRLGEGTGVALAMKLVEGAVAAFNGMATFESAAVSDKETESTK
ncbi:MAG: nicotinate-nucleotide--dimethylbenzimidazole phosphoribosyltransferase [Terracidiphilus sp.]